MKNSLKRFLVGILCIAMAMGFAPEIRVQATSGFDYSTWDANNRVRFNGYDWYVIGGDSSTVTLLAADSISVCSFDDREPHNRANNSYIQSKVKRYLDSLTDAGGSFADVADAIKSVDLPDVGVTGAKLYLLSVDEALAVSEDLRKTEQKSGRTDKARTGWWLRTPVAHEGYSMIETFVGDNGTTTDSGGDAVWDEMDVRPALKLDLGAVDYLADKNEFVLHGGSGYDYSDSRFDYSRWNNARKVIFNGMEWFVTGAGDNSVTLFASDPIVITAFGDDSTYSTSNVKYVLEYMTGDENGGFYNVARTIKNVDLPDVGVSGAKLYLPSFDEALAMPVFMRKGLSADDPNYCCFWLRSVGAMGIIELNAATIISDTGEVARYDDNGNIIEGYATSATLYNGVRPALQLDLDSVTFSQSSRTFEPCRDLVWEVIDGKSYWYEDNVRQGTASDTKCFSYDGTLRGREIYDRASDGWYWLDVDADGAKAVGKEVFMPYIYQNESEWKDNEDELNRNSAASGAYAEGNIEHAELADQIKRAIQNGTGKWVRYDNEGKMLKGWVTIEGELADLYPNQIGNRYYYDRKTGLMAKGETVIDGETYYFDEITGVLR